MKTCRKYDEKTLSLFVDNALPPRVTATLEAHLSSCPDCRQTVEDYHRIGRRVARHITTRARDLHRVPLEEGRVQSNRRQVRFFDFSFGAAAAAFLREKKIYLQTASVVAILLTSMLFLQDQAAPVPGPSAIVNAINGETASVMVLETRGAQRHTIIWYKES